MVTRVEPWRSWALGRMSWPASSLQSPCACLRNEAETLMRSRALCEYCLLALGLLSIGFTRGNKPFLSLRRVLLWTVSCHTCASWGLTDSQHGHELNLKLNELQWSPPEREKAPVLSNLTSRPLMSATVILYLWLIWLLGEGPRGSIWIDGD